VADPVFYLGTHQPHWLETAGVPLFISHRRLARRRTLPRATRAGWALDSGGFSELSLYGEWRTTPEEYNDAVRRYDDEIGELNWAAPQDMMCEPFMLTRTGLTVDRHQHRTVDNFVRLQELWGDPITSPYIPVLQGDQPWHYRRCARYYADAGVDLKLFPLVGIGSVCRRQATTIIGAIFTEVLADDPDMPLHGFGVKTLGLQQHGHRLESADSMAWSFAARREPALLGCEGHRNCANCLRYALQWRTRVLAAVTRGADQPALFEITA
jgi:hypothetical protein